MRWKLSAFPRICAARWVLVLGAFFVGMKAPISAAEFSNPIMRGDWSDPGMIRVGDDYYTCRSSFGWQPGIPVAHSRDLLHWEYVGHAFSSFEKIKAGDTRNGIWGVEMGYNPNTRQFLIFAPTRDYEVYVFAADKPAGPYTQKSLGPQLGIDPGFFADDDGKLYLVLNRGIIYELERDGLKIKRALPAVDRSKYRYFEGPDLFKHGGWYYLLFSDGGTLPHEPSTISTLRAHSLEGPWEPDPNNPNMFSTDNGAQFESPAHGTLIDTPAGDWFLTYHACETAYYSLGRQCLMQPIEWTQDGWWRPVTGKIPTSTATAPKLATSNFHLAQSDAFSGAALGLQWFFLCPPDFSGKTWSLTEKPGHLRIHPAPGDLGSIEALPAIFQQRVIDKSFSFECVVNFDAREAREAAGLQMYHDPQMNFWLSTSVQKGEKRIEVGKYNLGRRTDLWSVPNSSGNQVHLKIAVDGQERATFFYGSDGREWHQVGGSIYFGASGYHLRNHVAGDPDLGWVGRYKEKDAPIEPTDPRLPDRRGNIWTGATFGIFAVRDGAHAAAAADFDHFDVQVTK